MQFSGTPSMMQ